MRTSLLFKQISRLQLFYCLILGIVVRILVGHLPHSGETQPPIGGDYEAQRHWMEVTVHLPVREWYSQTISKSHQKHRYGKSRKALCQKLQLGRGQTQKNSI